MSKSLKETVDIRRGDIPRSIYISRILEKSCKDTEKESTTRNDLSNQWSLSGRQPLVDPTDPSAKRDTTNG
jgi:hypothetical protein